MLIVNCTYAVKQESMDGESRSRIYHDEMVSAKEGEQFKTGVRAFTVTVAT